MNEFLQNLRSNANKNRQYNRNRKSYDGNNQYGNANHSNSYDRRKNNRSHDNHQNDEQSFDFNKFSDNMIKAAKNISDAMDRRADAEMRKAAALENISVHLQSLTAGTFTEKNNQTYNQMLKYCIG